MRDDLLQELKRELYENMSTIPHYPLPPTKNSTITDMVKLAITIGSALFSIFGAFFAVKVEVASLQSKVQSSSAQISELRDKVEEISVFRYNAQKDLEYHNLSFTELRARVNELEKELGKIKAALDKRREE